MSQDSVVENEYPGLWPNILIIKGGWRTCSTGWEQYSSFSTTKQLEAWILTGRCSLWLLHIPQNLNLTSSPTPSFPRGPSPNTISSLNSARAWGDWLSFFVRPSISEISSSSILTRCIEATPLDVHLSPCLYCIVLFHNNAQCQNCHDKIWSVTPVQFLEEEGCQT